MAQDNNNIFGSEGGEMDDLCNLDSFDLFQGFNLYDNPADLVNDFVRYDEYSLSELSGWSDCEVCMRNPHVCGCYRYPPEEMDILDQFTNMNITDPEIRYMLSYLSRLSAMAPADEICFGFKQPSHFSMPKFISRNSKNLQLIKGLTTTREYIDFFVTHPRLLLYWWRKPKIQKDLKPVYGKPQNQVFKVPLVPPKENKVTNVFKKAKREERLCPYYNIEKADKVTYKSILKMNPDPLSNALPSFSVRTMLSCVRFLPLKTLEYPLPVLELKRGDLRVSFQSLLGQNDVKLQFLLRLYHSRVSHPDVGLKELLLRLLKSDLHFGDLTLRNFIHRMAVASAVAPIFDPLFIIQEYNIQDIGLCKPTKPMNVYNAWQQYCSGSFDVVGAARRILSDKDFRNFFNYIWVFKTWAADVYRAAKYKPTTLSDILIGRKYVASYLEYHKVLRPDIAQPTMFTSVSKVTAAAGNLEKLNVDDINTNLEDLLKTQAKISLTMDGLNKLVTKIDSGLMDKVSGILDTFSRTMDKFNGMIPTFDTSSIIQWISEFLHVPPSIIDMLKQTVTASKLVSVLLHIILYRQVSSTILKTLIIVSVLHQLGLLVPIKDMIVNAWKHVKIALRLYPTEKDDEQPEETSGFMAFSSIIDFITMLMTNSKAAVFAFLRGFITMFTTVVPSVAAVRRLVNEAGNWGRNFHFIKTGAGAVKSIWTWLLGTFCTIWRYITLQKPEETELMKFIKEYDRFSIRAATLNSPLMYDYIKTNAGVRGHALTLYDEGLKLVERSRRIADIPVQVKISLSREMIMARKITEIAKKAEDYITSGVPAYHVCFSGAPGIGKTNIFHMINEALRISCYPDIDPGSLAYHVPLNNEYFDGYRGQKVMLIDDYNLVNDPVVFLKVLYLISNVPIILNMADLESKGEVNTSEFIISTTNDPYTICDSINCHTAFFRRRRHVFNLRVDPKFMSEGNLDRDKILSYYTKQHRTNCEVSEIQSCIEARDVWLTENINMQNKDYYEHMAQKDYLSMAYYDVVFFNPIENTPVLDRDGRPRTMKLSTFVPWLINDFREYREREAKLLETNTEAARHFVENLSITAQQVQEQCYEALRQLATLPPEAELTPFQKRLKEVGTYGKDLLETIKRRLISDEIGVDIVEECVTRHANDFNIPEIPEPIIPENEVPEGDQSEEDSVSEYDTVRETMDYRTTSYENIYAQEMDTYDEVEQPLEEMEMRTYTTLGDLRRFCLRPVDDTTYVLKTGYNLDFSAVDLAADEPRFGRYNGTFAFDPTSVLESTLATDFILRVQNIGDEYVIHFPTNTIAEYEITTSWFWESYYVFVNLTDQERLHVWGELRERLMGHRQFADALNHRATVRASSNRNIFYRMIQWSKDNLLLIEAILRCVFWAAYVILIVFFCYLIVGDIRETKYDTSPRLVREKPLAWRETLSSTHTEKLINKYERNVQIMKVDNGKGEAICQIFYIGGNVAIMPAHMLSVFYNVTKVKVSTPQGTWQTCIIDQNDVMRVTGKDIAAINFRHGERMYPTTTKLWPKQDTIGNLKAKRIAILRREPNLTPYIASTQIRGTSNITLPNAGKTFGVIYEGCAPNGSSGGLAFLEDNEPNLDCIFLGIQSASAARWGSIAPFTREDASIIFKAFGTAVVHDLPEEYDRNFVTEDVKVLDTPVTEIFHETSIYAIAPKNLTPYIGLTTELQPTEIAPVLPDVGREPAILTSRDPRRRRYPNGPHYLYKSANKYIRDIMEPVENTEFKAVCGSIVNFYRNSGFMSDLRVLSVEESIAGLPDARKLNNKTSMGLPYTTPKFSNTHRGKTSVIRFAEDGSIDYLAPWFKETCLEFLEKLESNEIPVVIQSDFMKDELRDARLGKENQTRLVTIMPAHVVVVARMLKLDYHSRLHKLAKKAFPVSVGINVDSCDVALMVHRLCSVGAGRNCFDLDVSNWDGHWPTDIGDMNTVVMNELYEGQYSIARRNIDLIEQHGFVQLDKVVTKKYRGKCSGAVGTGEENSDGHVKLIYLIWRKVCPVELKGWQFFRAEVVFFVYGDDVIFSVSDIATEFFNPINVSNAYKSLGWPVTPASKGSEIGEFCLWSELVFLKHRFHLADDGKILSRIDLDTIHSLLVWQRGDSMEQLYSNIDDAMMMLVPYGPLMFERYQCMINKALTKYYLRTIFYDYRDTYDRKYKDYWT